MDKSDFEASPRAIVAQRPWSRKRVVWAVLAVVAAAVGSGVMSWLSRVVNDTNRHTTCASSITSCALFVLMYAEHHGDRLPTLVRGRRDEWAIAAAPYASSMRKLWCAADPDRPDTDLAGAARVSPRNLAWQWRRHIGRASSYLMNASLSGVALSDLDDPGATIPLQGEAFPAQEDPGNSFKPVGRRDACPAEFLAGGLLPTRTSPAALPGR